MQGVGNSFWCLCAKKYQHGTWFDGVIEKIKRVQFLPHSVVMCNQHDHLHCICEKGWEVFWNFFLQIQMYVRVQRLE